MAILPGIDLIVEDWSDTEYWVYISIHSLLIIFYAVLIGITVANIWQILIKQQRWKTVPLLVFYIFVFLAVVLRELSNLTYNEDYIWWLLEFQAHAKQEVGIIQTWMMLELALRLHQSTALEKNPNSDMTFTNKLISFGRLSLIIFIAAHFLACVSFVIYMNVVKPELKDFWLQLVGFSFLAIAVLMGCVNTYLFFQIQATNRTLKQESDFFISEKRRLTLILILFDVSYLIRFIWDITQQLWLSKNFYYRLTKDQVFFLSDGLTLLALLILHRQSFLTKVSFEEDSIRSSNNNSILLIVTLEANQTSGTSSVLEINSQSPHNPLLDAYSSKDHPSDHSNPSLNSYNAPVQLESIDQNMLDERQFRTEVELLTEKTLQVPLKSEIIDIKSQQNHTTSVPEKH